MDTVLWVLQGLLGFVFPASGGVKVAKTGAQLGAQGGDRMPWVDDVSAGALEGIGLVEVLGALRLVLPHATGILPILTAIAAVGHGLTMLGALALHVKRGDGAQATTVNVVLMALAAFVAYGRFAHLA